MRSWRRRLKALPMQICSYPSAELSENTTRPVGKPAASVIDSRTTFLVEARDCPHATATGHNLAESTIGIAVGVGLMLGMAVGWIGGRFGKTTSILQRLVEVATP